MKNPLQKLVLVVITFTLITCAGNQTNRLQTSSTEIAEPKNILSIPEWFHADTNFDNIFIYAVATGASQDQNIAQDVATQAAHTILSQRVTERILEILEGWSQEANIIKSPQKEAFFTSTATTISTRIQTGSTILDQYTFQDAEGKWSVYLRLGMRIGIVRAQMVKLIKSDSGFHGQFSKSSSFQELELEIDNPQ